MFYEVFLIFSGAFAGSALTLALLAVYRREG